MQNWSNNILVFLIIIVTHIDDAKITFEITPKQSLSNLINE